MCAYFIPEIMKREIPGQSEMPYLFSFTCWNTEQNSAVLAYIVCVYRVCGWGVCFCVWLYFTVCVDRWVRKPPWYFWRWWKWFVMLADFIRTCQCRFPCKLVLSGGCSSVGRWFDPGCMPKNLGQDTNPCCSLIRLLEYECKCYIEKRLCENEVNKVGFMILQMCLSVYGGQPY